VLGCLFFQAQSRLNFKISSTANSLRDREGAAPLKLDSIDAVKVTKAG
jgi:hypothetical protein